MLGFKRELLFSDFCNQIRIVFARLLVHAQLFELHVQLEDFFEQIRGNNLLLDLSGGAGLLGGALGLFFEYDAFQVQQILRAFDGIFQRAVGVVEQGTLFHAPLLFLAAGAGVQIRMKAAAEFVEILFEGRDINVELRRQAEKAEVVDRNRRLHLTAGLTEMRGAHGSAGPAGVRILWQRFCADHGKGGLGRHVLIPHIPHTTAGTGSDARSRVQVFRWRRPFAGVGARATRASGGE